MEVVPFVDDLLRARTAVGDTLRVGRSSDRDSARSCDCEIDSASREVVRARHAANSAVALRSTPSRRDTNSRMDGQETVQVESSMGRQPPLAL